MRVTAPALLKKDDVKRLVAGCLEGGAKSARIEIQAGGSIIIDVSMSAPATPLPASTDNPWDSELAR